MLNPVSRRAGLFLLCAFFVLSLGVIRISTNYHGDERFYTDAAIRMIRTGDFWTPYFAHGAERFQKPVLSYWCIVSAYQVGGINMLNSRITSLAAAAALALVSVALYRSLFGRDGGAWAVIPILLTNSTMFLVAWRATPDMLSALFINLSLLGFIRLVTGAGPRKVIDPWLAYLGAGLAAATKGGLGVLPVAFAWTLCLSVPRLRVNRSRLWHTPSIIIGLAIGCFWFAAMLHEHGWAAWRQFFHDQVGAKVGADPASQISIIVSYLIAPFRHFLPWTLLLCPWFAGRLSPLISDEEGTRGVRLVVFAWLAVVLAIFCFGNIARPRYLLPMYPLVACLLARLSVRVMEDAIWSRRAAAIARMAASVFLVAGLVMLVLSWKLGAAAGMAGVAVMAASGWTMLRGSAMTGVGASFLLLVLGVELAIKPHFATLPETAQVERLLSLEHPELRVTSVGLPGEFLGKMNVLAGGRMDISAVPRTVSPERLRGFDAIALGELPGTNFPIDVFDVQPVGMRNVQWKPGMALEWLKADDPGSVLRGYSTPYYLAIRRDIAAP